MESDEDLPPDLEDFTENLQNIKGYRGNSLLIVLNYWKDAKSKGEEDEYIGDYTKTIDQKPAEIIIPPQEENKKEEEKQEQKNQNAKKKKKDRGLFGGGMKKGFLFSNKAKKKPKSKKKKQG